MRSEVETKIRKIKKVSTILRVTCKGLLAIVTFLGVACTICLTFGVGGVNFDKMIFNTAGLALGYRLILGAVTVVTWGVLFKSFYHLHRLFGNYQRGEIFTVNSAEQVRQFGIACLLWGLMNYIWKFSLVISMRPLRTFQAHVDVFIMGAVIVVLAWFMDMAAEINEENELTI